MESNRNYFILKDKKQIGPLTFEKLKLEGINRETKVWFEGQTDWVNVSEVPELEEFYGALPPPYTPEQAEETVHIPPPQPIIVNQPPPSKPKSNGMGKTSLIFGILSVVFSFIGITFFIAIPFALVSLVTGILGLVLPNMAKYGKGTAITGIALSLVAAIILYYYYLNMADQFSLINWNFDQY